MIPISDSIVKQSIDFYGEELQNIYGIPDGHIEDWVIRKQARMYQRIKGDN